MLMTGEVQFVVTIPPISRRPRARRRPQILIEADATDPVATVNAVSSNT